MSCPSSRASNTCTNLLISTGFPPELRSLEIGPAREFRLPEIGQLFESSPHEIGQTIKYGVPEVGTALELRSLEIGKTMKS